MRYCCVTFSGLPKKIGFLVVLSVYLFTSCGEQQETLLLITDTVSSYLFLQAGLEVPKNIQNFRITQTTVDQDSEYSETDYSLFVFVADTGEETSPGNNESNTYQLRYPLRDFHDSNVQDVLPQFFDTINSKLEGGVVDSLHWILEPGLMTDEVYDQFESFHSEIDVHYDSRFFNQSLNQNTIRNFAQLIPKENEKSLSIILTNQHKASVLGFLENYDGKLILLNGSSLVLLDNRIIGSFDLDLNDMLELIVYNFMSEQDRDTIIEKKIIFTRY